MLTRYEIYDVDPRFNHLTNFVDRVDECQRFLSITETHPRERSHNFLSFFGATGIGKTLLMDRIQFECKKHKLLVGRLRLENDQLSDPISMMTHLVNELGEEKFETWGKARRLWNSVFGLEEIGTTHSTTISRSRKSKT